MPTPERDGEAPTDDEHEVIAHERLVKLGYLTPDGEVTAKGRAMTMLVQKIGADKLRGLELDPALPWWMDVFRVPYDDMRERGVAIVQLGWEMYVSLGAAHARYCRLDREHGYPKLPQFGQRYVPHCTIPRDQRYDVMRAIAWSFCDGWYCAEKRNQRERHLNEEWYWRLTIPTYEMVRNRITDGFGFDDEEGSGDWLLACRIALDVTKERYNRDRR